MTPPALNRFARAALAVLPAALILSVILNIFLFWRGQLYYLQLNQLRLDPLGLGVYPATSPNPVAQTVIVFWGDSRAAAWTAPELRPEVTFINRGIGAQTTAQIVGRFTEHVSGLKPDVVILQAGINDLKTIPLFPDEQAAIIANCKANLQQMVALAAQAEADVIVTTIFPLGELPLERRPFWSDEVALAIDEVNQFLYTLESEHVTILDTARILSNAAGLVDPSYSQDFLHLNARGYEALNHELVLLLHR